MKQANTTDGEKVAAALENLNGVQGVIKTYNKPFSKTMHEGLHVGDFYLARWKAGSEACASRTISTSPSRQQT